MKNGLIKVLNPSEAFFYSVNRPWRASSSGFVADIFMEEIENKALSTFNEPPTYWKRLVDDTMAKIKLMNIESFLSS